MACTSEDKLLRSRVEDAIYLCNKRNSPSYLGFFDLREQALVRRDLLSLGCENWRLYGGYDGAERSMLAVFPDFIQSDLVEFPFDAVAFHYRKSQKLTHRDFLGTLLSVGIRRDTIGDILCGEGIAVAFLCDEIIPYVCEQMDRVGGEGVKITPHYAGDLPVLREYQELRDTIASPRLDVVVKSLVRVSREEAAHLIRSGLVSVDHFQVENVSLYLSAPCTVSVRGHGRFLIDCFGPETKKGRLQFTARKCI